MSFTNAKIALGVNPNRFVIVVLAGMLGRILIAIGIFAMLVKLLPMSLQPFLIAFLVLMVLGTAIEIWWLVAHPQKSHA